MRMRITMMINDDQSIQLQLVQLEKKLNQHMKNIIKHMKKER